MSPQYLMMVQLPDLFDNMKEAAEYIELELTPLSGLYMLIFFGFMDTFVCKAVHERYLKALAKEGDSAVGVYARVDVERPVPIAEARPAKGSSPGTRF